MNTKTIARTKWPRVLVLAVIALVFFIGMGLATSAHAAGPYTVSGQYITDNFDQYSDNWPSEITDLPDGIATKFYLYKVGTYTHDKDGKSVIQLIDPYTQVTLPGKGLGIKKEDYEASDESADGTKDNAWTKDWLKVAETLSHTAKSEDTPIKSTTEDAVTFSFTDISETGLYLVMGDSCDVKVNGQTVWWRPQPMLVQVFDGSTTSVNLKPEASIAHRFQVTKLWETSEDTQEAKDLEKLIRPKSVKVDIFYTEGDKTEKVYPNVVLDENSKTGEVSTPWTFTWEADRKHSDPYGWTVQEQALDGDALKYYTYSISPISPNATNPESDPLTSDDIAATSKVKIFQLTNTFSPKTLQLTKIMNDFVDHQANVSAVIVFELTGYETLEDNTDKQIYHKVVGMKYDRDTDAKQTLPVKNIPHTVTKLKVKELSGTNVTPAEGKSEQWATLDGDTFKVTFENNYNNTNFGGGVVNRYKANKDATGYDKPEQDGKIKQ